jgi:hypothetical protein
MNTAVDMLTRQTSYRHIQRTCRQRRHVENRVFCEQQAEAARLDAAIAANLEAPGYEL